MGEKSRVALNQLVAHAVIKTYSALVLNVSSPLLTAGLVLPSLHKILELIALSDVLDGVHIPIFEGKGGCFVALATPHGLH